MIAAELVALFGLDVDKASFKKGESALNGLIGFAKKLAGPAALGLMVHKFTEAADGAGKLASVLGVDPEFAQRIAYAADIADVSIDNLRVGMQQLASKGVKDLRQGMLSVAEEFEKLPNNGERIKFLREKFGRSGAEFAKLFADGRVGLQELMEEAEVFSPEDIKNGQKFNDEMRRLMKHLGYLRNDMVRSLITPLTAVITKVREFIKGIRETPHQLAMIKYAFLGIAGVLSVLAAKSALSFLGLTGPLGVLLLLVGLLGLAIEDVYSYFNGADSLTGRWIKFLDALKIDVDEPPALKWLKGILKVITDIQGAWQAFGKEQSGQTGAFFSDFLGMKPSGPGSALMTPEQVKAATMNFSSMSGYDARVPGRAPSAAAEAVNQYSQPAGAGTFSATINVQAAPGMDEKKLAEHTKNSFADFVREASGGIQ